MKLKSVLIVAAACTSYAFASYDLALVADNGLDVALGKFVKVHRYDAISGAYLGAFGSYANVITSMVTDPSQSVVYLGTSSQLLKVNYSTGELLQTRSGGFGALAISSDRSTIFARGTNSLSSYATSDLSVKQTVSIGYSPTSLAVSGNGFVVAYDLGAQLLRSYNPNTLVQQDTSGISGTVNQGNVAMEGGTGNIVLAGTNGTPAGTMQEHSLNAQGVFSSPSTTTYASAFMSGIQAIASAHSGTYVLGTHSALGHRIYGFSTGQIVGSNIGISQVGTVGPMTVALAPEPGSLFALAGLAAVVVLRKKRS